MKVTDLLKKFSLIFLLSFSFLQAADKTVQENAASHPVLDAHLDRLVACMAAGKKISANKITAHVVEKFKESGNWAHTTYTIVQTADPEKIYLTTDIEYDYKLHSWQYSESLPADKPLRSTEAEFQDRKPYPFWPQLHNINIGTLGQCTYYSRGRYASYDGSYYYHCEFPSIPKKMLLDLYRKQEAEKEAQNKKS